MEAGVGRVTPLLLLAFGVAAAQTPPVRVLILSGRNNHDWRTSTPLLRQILQAAGRFEVRVTEEPTALTAKALAGYDVLVSDYNGPRWGDPAESAVASFVRGGKGFVAVHGASYAFGVREVLGENMTNTEKREPPWPPYEQMLGASWTEEPRTGHGRRHVFSVNTTAPVHPVMAGLPKAFFISDELYHRMKVLPGVQVIASAIDAKEQNGTGRDEPVLMVNRYGKGRVFHTTLGHDDIALTSPGFISTFARGVEWAATGHVTLPVQISLDRKDTDAVRVLVVTGGHDYEASFDSMFDGVSWMRTTVDPHPHGLNGDLRKGFDVLVVYDMVPELTDRQRRNLVDFAEAGKGIVIMHHALASHQTWSWWRSLAGAQYYERPYEGNPKSTYQHDRDFTATPSGKHPILAAVPEMYMHDETYKGMWFAPDNIVLLATRDETADGPLVWISAYPRSRVVTIQPGHNRESHANSGFRRLVHNAIRWAASRR
jgi:type 1 glutamine amidotransferase